MTNKLTLTCLAVALCTPLAFAQTAAGNTANSTAAPVAFVYVSSSPNGAPNEVYAYAAAANGQLTAVPGSPFQDKVAGMAVNGKYLFGASTSGKYVEAFLIESNGALQWATWTDVSKYNTGGCAYPGSPVLDHSGADLYLDATTGGSATTQSTSPIRSTGRPACSPISAAPRRAFSSARR